MLNQTFTGILHMLNPTFTLHLTFSSSAQQLQAPPATTMPRRPPAALAASRRAAAAHRWELDQLGWGLRHLAGDAPQLITGAVEDLLVRFFSDCPRKKALLERVHARACGLQRRHHATGETKAQLRAFHTPLQLLNLVLEMGAPRTGYQRLVSFCPACYASFAQLKMHYNFL